ncbi:MAG: sulfurtransferase TusA family protein [Actinobacteria bacterium]|nr:sulfurtransferase TusA family protein [Actinomycetota bacterium]
MADQRIEVRDARCPIPILRASEALRRAGIGESIELVTTDPMAAVDVPAWVDDMGYDLKETFETDGAQSFVIVKA